MISRWRKKKSGSSHLPTTINSPLPSTPKPPRYSNAGASNIISSPSPMAISFTNSSDNIAINPNSVTCTNFLMGGQYYPGKDKQRLHNRRRTLWYRIFFSSSYRRGLSVLVLAYILLFYILNPGFNMILHYGKILARHPGDVDIDIDNMDIDDVTTITIATDGIKELDEQLKILYGGNHGLNLKPLDISKKNAKMLLDKLEKIKRSSASVEERKKLLAKLLPQWNKVQEEEENGEVEENDEEEEGGTGDDVMSSSTDEENENDNDNTNIVRTLHNKNHHHKESKCERGLSEVSPTFVSQTTLDRLPILLESCQRWTGPMIVTVYVTKEEYEMEWDHGIVSDVIKRCPHENLELIPYIAKSEEERKHEYPINTLRNIALDHVKTSHMIMLDIDMVPSEGLYNEVLTAIEMSIDARLDDDGDRGLDPKDAIVIPAFERKIQSPCETLEGCQQLIKDDPNFIPGKMSQLLRCIKGKDCIVFQSDVNWEGHADTKTKEWLKQEGKEVTKLSTIPCFKSLRYEPYVATPWCPLEANAERRLAVRSPRSPYYDERFYGYGKNKIQQIAHLRARGFKFHILQRTGFVIHFPHPESTTKEVWNNRKGDELHQQMDQLYIRYLKELQRQYEDNYIETPNCKIQREMKKRLNKTNNYAS